jgi:hypothetical protein
VRAVLVTTAILVAAFPPAALAGSRPIDPSVSQYVEMIPEATGPKATTSQSAQPAPPVSSALQKAAGEDAPVIARLVASEQRPVKKVKKQPTMRHRRPAPKDPRSSVAVAATTSPGFGSAAFGSLGAGGMSLVVLVLLAAVTPLAVARARR